MGELYKKNIDHEEITFEMIDGYSSKQSIDNIHCYLLDLDDLKLYLDQDNWSLSAWRDAFTHLVISSTNPNGKPSALIAYTRHPSWENAKIALKLGARDVAKHSQIQATILSKYAAPTDKKRLSLVNKNSVADLKSIPVNSLEGSSQSIEQVRQLVRKSAPVDSTILLRGKTGTGKERVANAIHKLSYKNNGPFTVVNCAAIAPELFESEMFGHVKGAFTGATQDRIGFLKSAEGGTLFLDEIAELPLEFQSKLLRVLQENVVTSVGSQKATPIDLRIITSTQYDLEELIRNNQFREDLYYRLKVLEIYLPELTERKADIPVISHSIIKQFSRKNQRPAPELTSEVLEKFLNYDWPGNIRELEAALEYACTIFWGSEDKEILAKHLPEKIKYSTMSVDSNAHLKEVIKDFEKEYIAKTVQRLGGSKEQAAEVLGLSLASLYRKLAA